MICLFSSIKEILPDSREYPFKGGACKARKSVIIDPCTCLPDSNNSYYFCKTYCSAHLAIFSGPQCPKFTKLNTPKFLSFSSSIESASSFSAV